MAKAVGPTSHCTTTIILCTFFQTISLVFWPRYHHVLLILLVVVVARETIAWVITDINFFFIVRLLYIAHKEYNQLPLSSYGQMPLVS